MNDVNYYKFSGILDTARMQEDSEVLVQVDDHLYRAYQTGKNGYALYLKKAVFSGDTTSLKVYIVNGDAATQALSETISLP